MQEAAVFPQQQRRFSNNKKIFIFMIAYFTANMLIKWAEKDASFYQSLLGKIKSETDLILFDDFISILTYSENYEGIWQKIKTEHEQPRSALKSQIGIFEIKTIKLFHNMEKSYYDMILYIIDGEYLEDGKIEYQFKCSKHQFSTQKTGNQTQTLFISEKQTVDGKYDIDDVFITKELGPIIPSVLNISITLHQNQPKIVISLKTHLTNLKLTMKKQNNKLFKLGIFAALLLVVSFGPFKALVEIIQNISSGYDSPSGYSLFTLCLASMWDTVVCLIALVYTFTSQENLILFMIPAFLMCLVFTSLEPRLMILVYQSWADHRTTGTLICRFNLIHYGSLVLIYPIILLTNFQPILFFIMSSILFPQIYSNGITGTRPNPSSKYYRNFILYRFLLIFYIKCYPDNIFRMRPDYTTGAACFLILAIQYFLVYFQSIYGPKKIMPRFMLPSLYNYNSDEEVNLQDSTEAADCAICLTPLNVQPPPSSTQLESQVSFRIMKTPCKHRYHSSCLIQWMKIKQDCPECRSVLPPYE